MSGAEGVALTVSDVRELLQGDRPEETPSLFAGSLPAEDLEADGPAVIQSSARLRRLVCDLVEAGGWDRVEQLASSQWREALLEITGTDAVLVQVLEEVTREALDRLEGADAARCFLAAAVFGSLLREVVSQVPVGALVTGARLGRPFAAVAEAACREDAWAALPAVVTAVLEDGHQAVVRYALERALAVPGNSLLSRVAPLFVAAEQGNPDVVAETWDLAGRIEGERWRSDLRAEILRRALQSSESNPGVLQRVEELARELPDDAARARSLAAVAERLWAVDPTHARRAAADAAAAARSVTMDSPQVLAEVARRVAGGDPTLAGALLTEAVERAGQVDHGKPRSAALAGIVKQAATVDRALAHALAAQAADVAGRVEEVPLRSWALAEVAPLLAAGDPLDSVLVARAVDVARSIPYEAERDSVLAAVVQQLCAAGATLLDRAEELVASISDDARRATAMARVARQAESSDALRGRDLLARAMDLAATVADPAARSQAFGDIAALVVLTDPGLAQDLAARATADARAALDVPPGAGLRARLAGARAGNAPAGAVLPTEAVVAAGGPLADPANRWGMDLRPLTAALRRNDDRSRELFQAVEHLLQGDLADVALRRRVIDLATAIPGGERDQALASLVRRLIDVPDADAAVLHQAAELARGIGSPFERAHALMLVARELALIDPSDVEVVRPAADLARTVSLDMLRPQALVVVAAQINEASPALAQELVTEALLEAEAHPDAWTRCVALSRVGMQIGFIDSGLAREYLARAIRLAHAITDENRRDDALEEVAQAIVAAGPADADLRSLAMDAIGSIEDEWVHDRAIIGIADLTAEFDPADAELLARAVELAEEIIDEGERSRELADIAALIEATHPSNQHALTTAADLARTLPDLGDRSSVLSPLAGRLGDVKLFADGTDWRTRPPGSFLSAVEAFIESLFEHHPEMAQQVTPSVERALREAEGLTPTGSG